MNNISIKAKGKSTKRKPHDVFRVAAIHATAAKFSVTDTYARNCINGHIEYGQYLEIRKYFQQVYQKIKIAVS